ncbi:hypothetical protein R1sor_013148 [Riccia sorocarpa]|uniref:AMP-dependent synthetase/ligase domain-containing protein n=1 Tax=Riccia sorocarpa TaxID=122646 RepID=A0ABD3HBT3_9MARC
MFPMGAVPHGTFAQLPMPPAVAVARGFEEVGSARRKFVGVELGLPRSRKVVVRRAVAGRSWKGGEAARQDKIRHFQLQTRCTLEPREYTEGVRKFAPLLEPQQSAVVRGSNDWKAVPDFWRTAAEEFGDRLALIDRHHDPPTQLTFKEAFQAILEFSEGLRVYGVKPDQKVALISENSHRWIVADQGIMAAGAVDVVRGSRSSTEELCHIIVHSDSKALVVDTPDTYNRLAPRLLSDEVSLMFVVVLWPSKSENGVKSSNGSPPSGPPMYTYDDLITSGRTSLQALAAANLPYDVIEPSDLATIVYTSGTSGNPKGVMLSHANLLHQIDNLPAVVQPAPGERFLSLLPPWHMYERSVEYFVLSQGVCVVYTSVGHFKEELSKYPSDFFVAVPLVFDVLYSGILKRIAQGSSLKTLIAFSLISISTKFMDAKRISEGRALSYANVKQSTAGAVFQWLVASVLTLILWPLHLLGKKLVYSKILANIRIQRVAISGGGSLSTSVDKFFEVLGITVLNGYGLTETSPVVAVRVPENNILGSVGRPVAKTEIIVVNPETGEVLPNGEKGIVKIRGPQIMKGYYKNPRATEKAIDENGFFNTGDIGWIAPFHKVGAARKCGGVLVLEGRAKDTIVLSTGENVEPSQVEEIALQSKLVKQIVVVGQDQRRLGALIVPDREDPDVSGLPEAELVAEIRKELKRLAPDMQSAVGPFKIISEPFTVENGLLTPTLKVKRDIILSKYKELISQLYQK